MSEKDNENIPREGDERDLQQRLDAIRDPLPEHVNEQQGNFAGSISWLMEKSGEYNFFIRMASISHYFHSD